MTLRRAISCAPSTSQALRSHRSSARKDNNLAAVNARGARARRASAVVVARAMTRDRDEGCDEGRGDAVRASRARIVGALASAIVCVSNAGASSAAPTGDLIALSAAPARVERVKDAIEREERVIVEEVRRDEEIGLQAFREGQTLGQRLDIFLEKEPPVAVFFAAMVVINGCFGLVYALFVRETSAGPGGEFGKVIAASRKEVVKGIFRFFNGALGTYTTRDRE